MHVIAKGVLLTVLVKPGAKQNAVLQTEAGIKVLTTAVPEDNKANLAVVKLIKKELGLRVAIVSGHKSKIKRLVVL